MVESLTLMPIMAAAILFAVALLFRTRVQLGVYAGLGLGGLCVFFVLALHSPPDGGPATLDLLAAVGMIVMRAAAGLTAGVVAKAIFISMRDRHRTRNTNTEITN